MSLITLHNVGKHFGAEEVLSDVSFRLDRGDHVGLVGVNGAGKSTLMRIIAGLEEPDSGSVAVSRGLKIVYLEQEPEFDDTHTLYEAMLATFNHVIEAQERLRVLEQEMEDGSMTDEGLDEYGHLQELIEHTGYDYRDRIERVLEGLGLERETWYTPVVNLSGGQRTRANLARTLLLEADFLLLDEPTNHLDIPAVEWLETYLSDLKRGFVIVAHDRYLLDRVTRRTLELSFRHVTEYDAPYSRYLTLKAEREERQRLEYEAQQRHIQKTEDFIRRYGAGQRSKEARGREKRLNRMERLERPQEEEGVALRLAKPARSGDIVLEVRGLVAGYPGNVLVEREEALVVRRGEKVAVIGPNGAGKTTLIRTLVGALPPLAGTVRWGSNTSVAYYSQTLGQLDERKSVLDEVLGTRAMSEEAARGYLGRFLFSGDDVFKQVRVLSGGEKSRVALAKLILEEPNVLLLDEPTNHLDITSRDALQAILADFGGTLIFVSHDRHLIDSIAGELWLVRDGTLLRFDGTYSDYAAGKARPLDHPARRPSRSERKAAATPNLPRLAGEAESLAGRLAELGATASIGQLGELVDHYAGIQSELEEANRQWLEGVRRQRRAFSDSPDRSAAGKPR